MRNIEVLDLSNNGIKRISSNPLRGLDWLVELKLDDNRICGIQVSVNSFYLCSSDHRK